MRCMASASNGATESCLIFLHFRPSGLSGIVSVTTTSCNWLASILVMAGPESTAWVAQADTFFAPCASNVSTACVRVPAVSIKSSRIMAFLPSTSPIKWSALASFGAFRLLSIIAIVDPRRFAKALARSTPPASGLTTTVSP
jgi:hypothetical protein